ncbi:MAG: polysialyltransferase family glycosyltransferase [Bacteroidales bacterium]|nr:polysialyltransferase family glycosyltransferase [Bacteroidales bacterium]
MKRSISIINTEIQLINVIEAIHCFECEENILVIGQFNIRMDRIKKIEEMMKEPLFKQHFKKTIHLPLYLSNRNPLRFIGYILAYIKFFFYVLLSKKFDCCFFGVVTDIIVKPIAYLTQYKNPKCMLCLIDEGTRTESEARERTNKEKFIMLQQNRNLKLFHGFVLSIARKWTYPALTYFTIYKPQLLPQDNIVENKYCFFKKNKISNINLNSNAVVIVGQPMYELHLSSLERYQRVINRVACNFSGKHIYYAPHPIETEYIKWLPNGITPLQTHYPLELVLIVNKVDVLVGFFSNVLTNAAYLGLCENIISIPLERTSREQFCETKCPDNDYTRLGIQVSTDFLD